MERIKAFGFVWMAKLQGSLSKGLSYYAIAQILECDYATVKKYAEREYSNKIINDDSIQNLKAIKELEWTVFLKAVFVNFVVFDYDYFTK